MARERPNVRRAHRRQAGREGVVVPSQARQLRRALSAAVSFALPRCAFWHDRARFVAVPREVGTPRRIP